MTSSGENTETSQGLVDWASVCVFLSNLIPLGWLNPDEWHLGVENLRIRLFKATLFLIPLAAFQVETMNVGTVRSLDSLIEGCVWLHLVLPVNLIDSNGILSCEVLLETSKERLSEEEAGDPEVGRLALVDPLVDFTETLDEVDDVGGERLERGVGDLGPDSWDPVVEESVADVLELGAHDDLTLDGKLDILERVADSVEQLVETKDLVLEHGVHRLLVHDWVLPLGQLKVQVRWQLLDDALACL